MSPVFTLLSFCDPSPLFLADILSTNSLAVVKSCTHFAPTYSTYLLSILSVCKTGQITTI